MKYLKYFEKSTSKLYKELTSFGEFENILFSRNDNMDIEDIYYQKLQKIAKKNKLFISLGEYEDEKKLCHISNKKNYYTGDIIPVDIHPKVAHINPNLSYTVPHLPIQEPKFMIDIYQIFDEYFLISSHRYNLTEDTNGDPSINFEKDKEYLCDQWEGLIEFLKDEINLKVD